MFFVPEEKPPVTQGDKTLNEIINEATSRSMYSIGTTIDIDKVKRRIRRPELFSKIMSAEQAADFIKDGMVVGMSGFTLAGDPKVIPHAYSAIAKGGKRKIYLMTGAALSPEVDGAMINANAISKRMPFICDRITRNAINNGEILYFDQNLSDPPIFIRNRHMPSPDIAVVEATAITENCLLVPTTSFGNSGVFLEEAKQILIEINLGVPDALEGIHDYYVPKRLPQGEPIPMNHPSERIGAIGVKIDPAKVVGIVLTQQLDSPSPNVLADPDQSAMAANLGKFFFSELDAGRLTETLYPLQAGIGSVANAALWGLMDGPWHDLLMYSEVLQDSTFDLIDCGKMVFASATAITVSPEKTKQIYSNFDKYKDKIFLRPQDLSNSAEIVRRINIIAVNTAMDVDIYGNVNSTHIGGTHMMNGIGGSGDFATNAHTTIFLTKSCVPGGKVSRVLPMVPHVDHNEHNVDVIITEQGIADLRGLAPKERAQRIINNCAHPSYRPQLHKYVEMANTRGGQTPHVIERAFEWFARLRETGTMLE